MAYVHGQCNQHGWNHAEGRPHERHEDCDPGDHTGQGHERQACADHDDGYPEPIHHGLDDLATHEPAERLVDAAHEIGEVVAVPGWNRPDHEVADAVPIQHQ